MVPLTMPMMRRTDSPARDSRSALTSGMAPPTAASNSRSTSAARAAANNSAPWPARTSLLAVTTGLPPAMAASSSSRAGSMPPMSSTTMSTSGWFTTAAASPVSSSSGTPGRGRSGERTATATGTNSVPQRAAISARRSSSSPTSVAPTVPPPRMPTPTRRGSGAAPDAPEEGGTIPLTLPAQPWRPAPSQDSARRRGTAADHSDVEVEEILVGLATDDLAGFPVADEDHRGA